MQADPVAYLQSSTEHYTTAVLAQCSWYFASPQVLGDMLAALLLRVDRVCISEYSLTASDARAVPHVLAVIAQATLECRKPTSISNVRTVLSPAKVRDAAKAAGLTLQVERLLQPPDGMFDGRWEVAAVLSKHFGDEIEQFVTDRREKAVVVAARDAVEAASELLKAKDEKIHTMDVWVATFVGKQ